MLPGTGVEVVVMHAAPSVAEPGSKFSYGEITTTNNRYNHKICIKVLEIII
jgi:hypothetical protein